MTVTATTSRVTYAGNGTTKTFTVPFYFLQNSDLVVIRRTSPNVETTLTLTTDYTVAGAGVLSGGSITLVTAPALNQTIIIYRDPAVTQTTDYQANDPFPAETHEQALDKLTMIAQRARELMTRSFRLSDGYAGSAATVIPDPEANKVIGWNPAGTALQNYDPSLFPVQITYGNSRADVFTGTGAQTSFTLTGSPGVAANMDVSVGGVTQIPSTNYTVSGTTLTFTTAPPNGVAILARYTEALAQGTMDGSATSFKQAGLNAVTRTAQDKMREFVSVKDFGAKGDGTTDDTQAIINAVAYAYSAAVDLFIPAGVYPINNTIFLDNDNLTIYGVGWNSIIKKTTDTGNGITIRGNFVNIRDLAFNGNNKNFSGIFIRGSDNRVSRCRVYNCYSHGIGRDGQLSTCRRNVVEYCYVHDNRDIGIACNTAPDSMTIGCVVEDSGLEGITDDFPGYRSGIIGNYLSNNCLRSGVGGIGVDTASNSLFVGNIVNNTQSSLPGICFQNNSGNVNYCSITGNLFINNTGGGILLGGNLSSGFLNFNNVISANAFQNNTGFDIKLSAGSVNNIVSVAQTNAVIIDDNGSGRNMKSGIRCNFRVFNNTLRTDVTGDGTAYTVPFDGETSDLDSNVSSGVFTAPITGVYQFNACVRLEGGSGQTSGVISIISSGSTSQQAISGNDAGTGGSAVLKLMVSDIFYLKKNDTVSVSVAGFGGSKNMDIAANANATYFSGALIG